MILTIILENKIEFMDTLNNMTIWDNSKRAKKLLVSFYILISLTVLSILSEFYTFSIIENETYYFNPNEFTNGDLRDLLIGLPFSIAYGFTVYYFICWFRRAYGNIHRLKIERIDHKESMALWGWMIPLLCFVYPYNIMKEILLKTQNAIKYFNNQYVPIKLGFQIGSWWGLYILSNFISRYVLTTAFNYETIEQIKEATIASMISDFIQIPEAILAIIIVKKIYKIENELATIITNLNGVVEYKK